VREHSLGCIDCLSSAAQQMARPVSGGQDRGGQSPVRAERTADKRMCSEPHPIIRFLCADSSHCQGMAGGRIGQADASRTPSDYPLPIR
jgi:hypothetical protein